MSAAAPGKAPATHADSTAASSSSGRRPTILAARSPPKHRLSRSRRLIVALAKQVPHIVQPSPWDCGLACVSMVLKSVRKYGNSDPVDLRMFVNSDAVAMGSVWTIDLAYLFRAFGLDDFTYYTTHVGINFNYASKSFYKVAFQTDSRRIHRLFADAHDNNVRVVPLLLSLDDMKRFLMSGRYALLMLVNLNSIRCRVCARKDFAFKKAEKLRRDKIKPKSPWYKTLWWQEYSDIDATQQIDETTESEVDWDPGVDSYLFRTDSDDELDFDHSESAGVSGKRRKGKSFSEEHRSHSVALIQQQRLIEEQKKSTQKSFRRSNRPYDATSIAKHSESHDSLDVRSRREFTEQTPLLLHDDDDNRPMSARQRIYQKKLSGSRSRRTSLSASDDSENQITLLKSVYSTIDWISAFVFRSNDSEEADEFKSACGSLSATPILNGQYISTLSQENIPALDQETRRETVHKDLKHQTLNGGRLREQTEYAAEQSSGVGSNSATVPMTSAESSPNIPQEPGNAGLNFRFPQALSPATPFTGTPPTENSLSSRLESSNFPPPPPSSPSGIPLSFLPSFLIPNSRSPQKHRAFSIPGTSSEKAAAAAAVLSNQAVNSIQTPPRNSSTFVSSSHLRVEDHDRLPPARATGKKDVLFETRHPVSPNSVAVSTPSRRGEIFSAHGLFGADIVDDDDENSNFQRITAKSVPLDFKNDIGHRASTSVSSWDLHRRLQLQDTSADSDETRSDASSDSCKIHFDGDSETGSEQQASSGSIDTENDIPMPDRSCFGGFFAKRTDDGGESTASCLSSFTRFLCCNSRAKVRRNRDSDEPEEFEGHYILLIGYDAQTDGFVYRDPGIDERICVMDSGAIEHARSGVVGSDHDVIVVRAGM
ncbi:guanylyl cyclase domain-containing protein 1 [Entophlyctis sp. JEL0112]|nr:guanylyl cyclase domain-containing protein 1 [Entophlyctis sp. JEL0112]